MEVRPTVSPVSLQLLASPIAGSEVLEVDGVVPDVTGVAVDSRRVQPGDLFAALQGEHQHGAEYAQLAATAGAVAALTDAAGVERVRNAGLAVLVVDNPRSHVGGVAAHVYDYPATKLLTLAVTGTNGKTTTTWLLEAGLRAAGHVTGLVGTVQTLIAGRPVPTVRTTPEAAELQALLAVMVEAGVTAVAVEVSSHALQLGRVDGCLFDVAGFTQFGSDHLDFHASVDEYFSAKSQLFTPRHSRNAVTCIDDEGGQRIASNATIPCQTLSTSEQAADWQVVQVESMESGGFSFVLRGPGGFFEPLQIQLPGRFNVANAALARAMLAVAGVGDQSAVGICSCDEIPGRMQPIAIGQAFVALVDYAHTPDALESVLSSLREETSGNLIVVIGCGGDRDASKRPRIGEVAARQADVVIVTDDNPRSEDPARIRAEVISGALTVPTSERATVVDVAGRGAAIEEAVRLARRDDVVLVAGKGHETGQEFADHTEPFDDREVLLEVLQTHSKDQQ